MSILNVLSLLGGLALFLHGMQMMGSGLEAAAGNRMKHVLERLTSNRFLGVAVGAGITAIIQSSSATTVMVVGFVNSGLMTLQQAVWIIMGANIGTTTTSLLITLDVGELAPLFAFLGIAVAMFVKKLKVQHFGEILAGLGILFIGMEMMSSAMMPLRDSEAFISLMTRFSNPLLGILAGMIFTAVIQSSSASVGILQTLADNGLIALPSAAYVLFGQNIGTCITAVLASVGTNRNAKRTTIIHLLFNIIGTTIFVIITGFLPLTTWIQEWLPNAPSAQISTMHVLFNVTTTLILLPLGNQLAKLATKILPERPDEGEESMRLMYIKPVDAATEYKVGTSAIVINGIWRELARMARMASKNVGESFDAVLDGNSNRLEGVEQTEEYVDFLNKEISKYISRMIALENNEQDSALVSAFFKVSGNLERIGDHAVNICEYTKMLEAKGIGFSQYAQAEIRQMKDVSLSAMKLIGNLDHIDMDRLKEISKIEQKIDDMTDTFRKNQMDRMQSGTCSDEACVLYSELLTDFERIGDHVLNIGEAMAPIQTSRA